MAQIWTIANLTSFIYKSTAHSGTDKDLDMSGLTTMLGKQCPNLQLLQLSFPLEADYYSEDIVKFAHLDNLFSSYHWPCLRILRVRGVHCSPATAVAFLAAHPTIEELRTDKMFGADGIKILREGTRMVDPPVLAPDTLPNLRVLGCDISRTISILSTPSSTPRPIEYINDINMRDPVLRDRFLESLANTPSLRRLDLEWSAGPEDVIRLSQVAKSLSWLENGSNNTGRGINDKEITCWINAIAHFPELTAFHNAPLLFENDADGCTRTVTTLSKMCPKLRRIDAWDRSASYGGGNKRKQFAALFCDETGQPSWRILPQDDWGGF